MNLFIKDVKYESLKSLETEIKLYIAMARVEGRELTCFALENPESCEIFYKSASRILRAMKRGGFIKLFVTKSDMQDHAKTETAFILNKHPELSHGIGKDSEFVLVKL